MHRAAKRRRLANYRRPPQSTRQLRRRRDHLPEKALRAPPHDKKAIFLSPSFQTRARFSARQTRAHVLLPLQTKRGKIIVSSLEKCFVSFVNFSTRNSFFLFRRVVVFVFVFFYFLVSFWAKAADCRLARKSRTPTALYPEFSLNSRLTQAVYLLTPSSSREEDTHRASVLASTTKSE